MQGIKFKCEGSVHSKETTKSENKHTHNSNNNLLPNYICDCKEGKIHCSSVSGHCLCFEQLNCWENLRGTWE